MLKCEVYAYSTSPHVSQLYTGFSLLALKGEIRLLQRSTNYSHKGRALMRNLEPHQLDGLFAVVNGQKVLFYDTRDSSEFYDEALETADAYFKRSYSHSKIPERHKHRLFPLGLNYELYTARLDRYRLSRLLLRKSLFKSFPKRFLRNAAAVAPLGFVPTPANMCAKPGPGLEPRVLFMVRAWDPDDNPPGLTPEQKEERVRINETRARCLSLLSRELGDRFCGGFAHTAYANRHFRNLLLKDRRYSRKGTYVSLLQRHPICVATTGLHGSIGWKMGEYVAFSRAIVSERLNYSVPCGFEEKKNYLKFDDPEECVHQTMELVENKELRRQMMENNRHYYETCLAPERLILRTLNMVTGAAGSRVALKTTPRGGIVNQTAESPPSRMEAHVQTRADSQPWRDRRADNKSLEGSRHRLDRHLLGR